MSLIPGPEDREWRLSFEEVDAIFVKAKSVKLGWFQRWMERNSRATERMLERFCKEWDDMKAMMQPGDELWEVCTDLASWRARMGWAGIQLRRDGKAIASIMLRMN